MRTPIRRVAVIGAGTIGTGWATFFASRGLRVHLFDFASEKAARALADIRSQLGALAAYGLISGSAHLGSGRGAGTAAVVADEAAERVRVAGRLTDAVGEADMVQEAVFETYEAKRAVFAAADDAAPEDVLLASSSSGLLMTEIQRAVRRHPERCLVAHPINPVYLIPLVELVPGAQTDPAAMRSARAFFESLGKVPVTLTREVPGYLENRMTAALWREAIDLVHQGVASVEDVDRAIWAGPGLRYALLGPLMLYHLGGGEGGVRAFVQHLGPAVRSWWEDLRTWAEIPEGAVDALESGLGQVLRGRTIGQVAAWRDARLVELLKVLSAHPLFGEETDAAP